MDERCEKSGEVCERLLRREVQPETACSNCQPEGVKIVQGTRNTGMSLAATYINIELLAQAEHRCKVAGCVRRVANEKTFGLCDGHWQAWHYFHSGYTDGYEDRAGIRRGRSNMNSPRWERAMEAFLRMAESEIVALSIFTEGLMRARL